MYVVFIIFIYFSFRKCYHHDYYHYCLFNVVALLCFSFASFIWFLGSLQ